MRCGVPVVLFLSWFAVRAAADCANITDWSTFKLRASDNTIQELVLCPVRILKPVNDQISILRPFHLACAERRKCVISGEGSHFRVQGPNSLLELSGFVLRGATQSAVRVLADSPRHHVVEDCLFRLNFANDRGGAIRLANETQLTVRSSKFEYNQGIQGGAIFHQGLHLVVERCIFSNNEATNGGGAIAIVRASTALIQRSPFTSNRSTLNGGGVCAQEAKNVLWDHSTTGSDNSNCDGVYDRTSNVCRQFATLSYAPQVGVLSSTQYGVHVSNGLLIRLIARTGETVRLSSKLAKATFSSLPFHIEPDGAHVFALKSGGWVYVSNAEGPDGTGGVYSLEFDRHGGIREYKMLMGNTTRNCAGGVTPWNSWVSCEEHPGGHCWQIHPRGNRLPEQTTLGGLTGGNFEAFAYHQKDDEALPHFFVTEDTADGALRRYTPHSKSRMNWNMLHRGGGTLEYLELFPTNMTYRWTLSEENGRKSASQFFRHCEGILQHGDELMFVSKTQRELFRLNLKSNKYTVESTRTEPLPGGGRFRHQPDQLFMSDSNEMLYFTEDGGPTPGVYVHDGHRFVTLVEAVAERYFDDETTGLGFSPDGKFFYFCIQETGFLFQLERIDGGSFERRRLLKWKYDMGRNVRY